MVGLIALIRRSLVSGVELELAAAEARRSAVEKERSSLAIDAFLGKAKAVRKFARLGVELEEIKDLIDRLERDSREGYRVRLEQPVPVRQ
jgi:hypothetical protein